MTIKAQTETDQSNCWCWCGYEGPTAEHPAHHNLGPLWPQRPAPKIEELLRGARILHAASLHGAAYALESLAVAFEKLEEGVRPL